MGHVKEKRGIAFAIATITTATLATGCAQGESDQGLSTFGSPAFSSQGPADAPGDATDASGGGSEGSDEGTGSDEGGSDDGQATSDAGEGTTGDGMEPPPADDGAEPATTDDGMEPPPADDGVQPATGMYANCTEDDFVNCNAADGCMTVSAATGDVGFCTAVACSNPAVDCDPAPAGTSVTPTCIPIGEQVVCALDCSVAACPAPMQCHLVALDEAGTTTVEICA